MKIGSPKYEQSKKNYFNFKKNQNTFILRVLPPMGDLADAGKWSVYHRVEFGYSGTDGRMRPFLSPRVVNYSGMVEVESEAHKRREKIKTQQAQAKLEGNLNLVEQCTKMLQKYNQDAKHHLNAVDLQGNIGLFKIGHKGFQALKAEVDRLRSEGIDPIGVDNGRFFVFTRSGTGRDTLYTVNEYKQKQEIDTPSGRVVAMVDFPHRLTDTILSKLSTSAFELDKIYPSVTPEEEYRIVHEGASAVDQILGRKSKTDAAEKTNNTLQEEEAASPTLSASNVGLSSSSESLEEDSYDDDADSGTSNFAGLDLSSMSEEDFFKKVESGNF